MRRCATAVRRLSTATIVVALIVAGTSRVSTQSPAAPGTPPPSRAGWFTEPRLLTNSIDFVEHQFEKNGGAKKAGFYPEFSNLVSGAGWLSAGPGYRHYLLNEQLFVDGSAAVSWHLFKMVQGRIEVPALLNDRVTIGAQAMWQDLTQVSYFGAGPDSLESNHSQYRIKTTDVVGYVALRPNDWLTFGGKFGWLRDPLLGSPAGTFRGDEPDTRIAFRDEPGASLPSQPRFQHGSFDVTSDTRDYRSHPTTGALYRAAVTIYRDQGPGAFSFTEYQLEGLQLVPLAGARWVLALRGWAVLNDVPNGREIPVYLQPSIGGHNTLRGYTSYRFHDRNTLVANAESRWAIYEHVDLAAFLDAGNVAASVGGLNLAKTSYGAGVRLHTTRATFARADVARGAEGWRVVFRTGDSLRLGRLSRRIAAIPFAP
jgi:hypothetical protein